MKKIFLIAVLLFIFRCATHCQEDSSSVLLKDGTQMNILIQSVDPWGFTLSDNRTLLFKVVSELRTDDTMLVQKVVAQVDSVKIREQGNTKILDFDNAVFKKAPVPEGSSLSLKSITLNLIVDYGMNYGFQLAFSIKTLQPFVIAPGAFFGSTIDSSFSSSGAALGAGWLWEHEQSRTMILLNYGLVSIETNNAAAIILHPFSLSVDQQFFAGSGDKFILSVGGYGNLNNIQYNGKRRIFGVRLGFGLNLSVFSFYKQ